jgi:hypothetical protein
MANLVLVAIPDYEGNDRPCLGDLVPTEEHLEKQCDAITNFLDDLEISPNRIVSTDHVLSDDIEKRLLDNFRRNSSHDKEFSFRYIAGDGKCFPDQKKIENSVRPIASDLLNNEELNDSDTTLVIASNRIIRTFAHKVMGEMGALPKSELEPTPMFADIHILSHPKSAAPIMTLDISTNTCDLIKEGYGLDEERLQIHIDNTSPCAPS